MKRYSITAFGRMSTRPIHVLTNRRSSEGGCQPRYNERAQVTRCSCHGGRKWLIELILVQQGRCERKSLCISRQKDSHQIIRRISVGVELHVPERRVIESRMAYDHAPEDRPAPWGKAKEAICQKPQSLVPLFIRTFDVVERPICVAKLMHRHEFERFVRRGWRPKKERPRFVESIRRKPLPPVTRGFGDSFCSPVRHPRRVWNRRRNRCEDNLIEKSIERSV